MSDFWSVDAAYRSAATASLYETHVTSAAVTRVARAQLEFQRLRAEGDDAVSELATALQYARYRLMSAPLPAAHPELGLLALASDVERQLSSVAAGSRGRRYAEDAVEALRSLVETNLAPLADAVRAALLDAADERCVVALRTGHYVRATSAYLEELGSSAIVTDARGLALIGSTDLLLCVGPVGFFSDAAVTAARAETTCFITYPFSRAQAPTSGLFGPLGGLAVPKLRTPAATEPEPVIDPIDFSAAMAEAAAKVATRRPAGGAGGERMMAVMLALAGGYAVWTEDDDHNKLLCVDADDPARPTIMSKYLRAVEPGDYIILRDGEADSDLIRAMADAQFGAARLRKSQERWKAALRSAVEKAGGPTQAAKRLRANGVGASNLHYWMGTRCIKPQSLRDFAEICRFAEIAGETADLWRDLEAIFTAHLRAGQSVRQQLEARLLEEGGEQMLREGVQRYDVPDLGSLVTLRVLYRLPEPAMIPQTRIDRLFLAMEGGWPE